METIGVIIRGREYVLPKPVYEYLNELIEWSEAMRNDAMRQMVIQLKTVNLLRAATNTPDPFEKSWIAFCFYFPAYIAMAGLPTPDKLGSLLIKYFPLSYVAFRQDTFCLKDDHYSYKAFSIVIQKESDRYGTYLLIIEDDVKTLLHNICEALRHVGCDFQVEDPFELQKLAYGDTG